MVQTTAQNKWNVETTVAKAPSKVKARARRRSARSVKVTLGSVEAVVAFLVVALTLVYAGAAIAQRIVRPRETPVVHVAVQPGDTLWSVAARYGNPDDYILQRVDRLAALNHLDPASKLQPGETLNVRVENPAELNRMEAAAGTRH